jgi:NhaP-type Na+/H+ or K+/H+ antiporter
MLAMVGLVIVVSTLLSGVIEKTGLPHVAVFLILGAVVGPAGIALLDPSLDSPLVQVVSTLSLALVLFTDAIGLDVKEIRRNAGLAVRVLGPGTVVSAAVVGVLAWALLGLSPPAAAILGAALSSTDPVLLRGLTRRSDLHAEARLALRLESGLNDVVLLPVVIVSMAFLGSGQAHVGKTLLSVGVLGPLAGVGVGFIAVSALNLVRKRFGVRRDYESIYSLGVAFTAYAAAEALHGSGFLAAFAAGLTIVVLDVELCDCFIEYGETTAEMALLFTFVLFGASSIWSAVQVLTPTTLLFAAAVLLVRPIIFAASLVGSGVDRKGRLLIGWFGPRGLSSLLLVLLPVFAGLPGAAELFRLCSLVVLLSVVVHGGSLIVLRRRRPPGEPETAPAPAEPTGPAGSDAPIRISIDEAAALPGAAFIDVRTERSASESHEQIRGSRRVDPADDVVGQMRRLGIGKDENIVLYCA